MAERAGDGYIDMWGPEFLWVPMSVGTRVDER